MCRADSDDLIEVTPEMIAAGIDALVAYNPKFELEEDAVRRIYRAMVRVIRKKQWPEPSGELAGMP